MGWVMEGRPGPPHSGATGSTHPAPSPQTAAHLWHYTFRSFSETHSWFPRSYWVHVLLDRTISIGELDVRKPGESPELPQYREILRRQFSEPMHLPLRGCVCIVSGGAPEP